jgi:hypothetical protein
MCVAVLNLNLLRTTSKYFRSRCTGRRSESRRANNSEMQNMKKPTNSDSYEAKLLHSRIERVNN